MKKIIGVTFIMLCFGFLCYFYIINTESVNIKDLTKNIYIGKVNILTLVHSEIIEAKEINAKNAELKVKNFCKRFQKHPICSNSLLTSFFNNNIDEFKVVKKEFFNLKEIFHAIDDSEDLDIWNDIKINYFSEYKGDCEEFALLLYKILINKGVSQEKLKLSICIVEENEDYFPHILLMYEFLDTKVFMDANGISVFPLKKQKTEYIEYLFDNNGYDVKFFDVMFFDLKVKKFI